MDIVTPDIVDSSGATVIYVGYKSTATYKIMKVDSTDSSNITFTYAIGKWEDRTSLTYKAKK